MIMSVILSSVKRILRKEVSFNRVIMETREVVVNTFPMGIDYDKFKNAANHTLIWQQTKSRI